MDRIMVGYDRCTYLMEYVGPYYNYKDWVSLVQYTQVCAYMDFKEIIYSQKTKINIKEQHCTLTEGQKPQGIVWGL